MFNVDGYESRLGSEGFEGFRALAMVSLSTWFRYAANKFEYSLSLGWKVRSVLPWMNGFLSLFSPCCDPWFRFLCPFLCFTFLNCGWGSLLCSWLFDFFLGFFDRGWFDSEVGFSRGFQFGDLGSRSFSFVREWLFFFHVIMLVNFDWIYSHFCKIWFFFFKKKLFVDDRWGLLGSSNGSYLGVCLDWGKCRKGW